MKALRSRLEALEDAATPLEPVEIRWCFVDNRSRIFRWNCTGVAADPALSLPETRRLPGESLEDLIERAKLSAVWPEGTDRIHLTLMDEP